MKSLYIKRLRDILLLSLLFAQEACVNDLNTTPIDEDIQTEEKVLTDDQSYKELLAKCYAGFILGGQTAVDGEPDISSINGSFSSYLRFRITSYNVCYTKLLRIG